MQRLYQVEYIIFYIKNLKNKDHNIQIILPQLDNTNYRKKD